MLLVCRDPTLVFPRPSVQVCGQDAKGKKWGDYWGKLEIRLSVM